MSPSVDRFSLDADDPAHPLHEALNCLLDNGLDGAGEALRLLVNQASLIERERFIGVAGVGVRLIALALLTRMSIPPKVSTALATV